MANFKENTTIGGFIAFHIGILPPSYQFPSGTTTVFGQTTAPIGWTKLIDNDDCALRVVNGECVNGGTSGFSTVFSEKNINASFQDHTLTTAQMASHNHSWYGPCGGGSYWGNGEYLSIVGGWIGSTGGGGSHSHSGGSTLNIDVKYIDIITASKD